MSRTDTTRFTTFDLPPPEQATLAFASDLASIIITVPRGSQWRMRAHWHVNTDIGCKSVQCLSGHIHVFRANERTDWDHYTGAGRSVNFKPGEVVAW